LIRWKKFNPRTSRGWPQMLGSGSGFRFRTSRPSHFVTRRCNVIGIKSKGGK
jgi:hypothetical protein